MNDAGKIIFYLWLTMLFIASGAAAYGTIACIDEMRHWNKDKERDEHKDT